MSDINYVQVPEPDPKDKDGECHHCGALVRRVQESRTGYTLVLDPAHAKPGAPGTLRMPLHFQVCADRLARELEQSAGDAA